MLVNDIGVDYFDLFTKYNTKIYCFYDTSDWLIDIRNTITSLTFTVQTPSSTARYKPFSYLVRSAQ